MATIFSSNSAREEPTYSQQFLQRARLCLPVFLLHICTQTPPDTHTQAHKNTNDQLNSIRDIRAGELRDYGKQHVLT